MCVDDDDDVCVMIQGHSSVLQINVDFVKNKFTGAEFHVKHQQG